MKQIESNIVHSHFSDMTVSANKVPIPSLIAVSVIFVVLAGLFNAVSPFRLGHEGHGSSNPDEQAHYEYIEELSGGKLPVFRANGTNYEAHQPPLYYVLCVPVNFAVSKLDIDDRAGVVRWVSTIFGVALIWTTFYAIRCIIPNEPLLPLACAAFVAFIPMNISLCSSISNDSLTNLITALGLWQLGRICRSAKRWSETQACLWQTILLGMILGLGIWTKTSTVLLFPVVVLVLCVLSIKIPEMRRSLQNGCVVSCLVGIIIGSPWLIRNTMLYGDPVAQHIFLKAFQNTAHPAAMMAKYHLALSDLVLFWTIPWTFESFWGVFNSMRLFLPYQAYALLAFFSLLSLVGLTKWFRLDANFLDIAAKVLILGYAALITFTAAAFIRFNLVFFQAQGRYFYTALVPIALFYVLGLRTIEPQKYRYKIVGLMLTILLLLDIGSIGIIARHFTP